MDSVPSGWFDEILWTALLQRRLYSIFVPSVLQVRWKQRLPLFASLPGVACCLRPSSSRKQVWCTVAQKEPLLVTHTDCRLKQLCFSAAHLVYERVRELVNYVKDISLKSLGTYLIWYFRSNKRRMCLKGCLDMIPYVACYLLRSYNSVKCQSRERDVIGSDCGPGDTFTEVN